MIRSKSHHYHHPMISTVSSTETMHALPLYCMYSKIHQPVVISMLNFIIFSKHYYGSFYYKHESHHQPNDFNISSTEIRAYMCSSLVPYPVQYVKWLDHAMATHYGKHYSGVQFNELITMTSKVNFSHKCQVMMINGWLGTIFILSGHTVASTG